VQGDLDKARGSWPDGVGLGRALARSARSPHIISLTRPGSSGEALGCRLRSATRSGV